MEDNIIDDESQEIDEFIRQMCLDKTEGKSKQQLISCALYSGVEDLRLAAIARLSMEDDGIKKALHIEE